MERSIVTLKRLFSKDIKTEQNNVMQNICVFRVILFCFVICTSMAILNISRIFIVDHKLTGGRTDRTEDRIKSERVCREA